MAEKNNGPNRGGSTTSVEEGELPLSTMERSVREEREAALRASAGTTDAAITKMTEALSKAFGAVAPQQVPVQLPATTETRKGGSFKVNGQFVDAEGRVLCDAAGHPVESHEEAQAARHVIDPNAFIPPVVPGPTAVPPATGVRPAPTPTPLTNHPFAAPPAIL